jgi:hypothetical protein
MAPHLIELVGGRSRDVPGLLGPINGASAKYVARGNSSDNLSMSQQGVREAKLEQLASDGFDRHRGRHHKVGRLFGSGGEHLGVGGDAVCRARVVRSLDRQPRCRRSVNLGKVIVCAKLDVDPRTAAVTVTSDDKGPYAIPPSIDGIPLQIKHVNVTINRSGGFTFNPD